MFRFLCSTSLPCFVGQVLFNVQVSVQCVTPVFCGQMLFNVQVPVQCVTPVFCGVGVVQCLGFCVVRHSRVLWLGVVQCVGFCVVRHSRVLWGRCCSMFRLLCCTSLTCLVGQVLLNVQISVQYVTPVFCGVGVVQCLGFCVVRHFRVLLGRCCSMFRFLCSASLPCFVGQVLFNVQVSVQCVTPVFCGQVLFNVQVSVQYVTPVFCGVGVVQCLGCCVVRHSRVWWGRCCSMFRFLCSTSLPCFVGQVLFNVYVSVQCVTPVFCGVGVVQCLGFCVVCHSRVLWGRCCSMFRFLCSTSLQCFVWQALCNVQVSVQYVTPVFCGVGVVQCLGFCVVRHTRVLWGRCCSMLRFLCSASLPCFVGQVLFNAQVSVQCVTPVFYGVGVVQCLRFCVIRHSVFCGVGVVQC